MPAMIQLILMQSPCGRPRPRRHQTSLTYGTKLSPRVQFLAMYLIRWANTALVNRDTKLHDADKTFKFRNEVMTPVWSRCQVVFRCRAVRT